MRFMMKAVMDTDTFNELARQGEASAMLESILAEQKPEAVYFVAEYGQRTAILFVNFDDPSDLARMAEPWFVGFNASVEIQPAMTAEDLAKAGGHISGAAEQFSG